MTSALTGGCLCGAVRYRTATPPGRVSHCHCQDCRKHSGAPFQTWANFATTDILFEAARPAIHASSAVAERGFCANCGTPLTFQYLETRDRLSLSVGSLDDPSAVTPECHYFAERPVSWLHLDDGLPRLDRHGDPIDDDG
ncbi:MAG: GFA family protein [Alphaproteobacteria bacterium]|jgi:hypothetical protein|nr:GFA family protein [Alphaproteobacteria bacterium]